MDINGLETGQVRGLVIVSEHGFASHLEWEGDF